jgi:tetratricopeptide (TPR) repeat protein
MEVDDNGLRSSPSAGHFTIFEMAARILNTPETESTDDKGEDKLWQLRNYAATFWMEHFLDVDLENTSADGVQSVISSLHTIMNPEGEALKNIELCVNNFDNVSLFGGPADHLRDQFFDHFNVWLNRARNLDVSSFSPEVLNWISSCSSQEETIVHLAKGHVLNWFKAHRSYEARGSFEFARTTLCMVRYLFKFPLSCVLTSLQTKSGPPLSKDTDTDQEHAEGDILKVSIAFPEIPKTSQALRAIGMVFYSFDNYSAALAQMDQSLEIATAITDRFDALFWIGDIQLNLSEKANEEDQKDHVLKAYDAINASIALYESSDEVKKFAETVDMKIVVQVNLTNRAICEVKLGEIDKAIASMDEAYRVMGSDDRALPGEFVDDITASLEKAGDFEKLISVVGHFHKFDLLVWLGFPSANGHDRFQHAAWECKKQDFMIKKYEDMIVESDKYNAGAHARSQLATIYHYVVVPNLKESKRLLFEIMDGKKGVPFDDADENFIFDTRLQLADVLLEQFRAATDPMSKIALQGEMKTLALQDKVALRHDFNPYESQTTISLALMTGKMGPTNEFQSLMDNTFREAINSLTDNEAWNDSGGFRILAKVLAFVPEMHRDAQIASSLQFSAVNEKLFKEADESRDGQPSDTNIKEPLAKGNDTESAVEEKEIIIHEITEVKIQPQEASPNVQEIQLPTTTTEEVTADITEDLNPNSNVLCNGCDRSFNNWRDGAVYGCIECTDCDLCEDCFKKIDRCNKGEPWTEWKRYCGENHKYIRGPIAGWKGVKDGVIRIERVGDGEQGGGLVEEVEFGVWIDGLQNRWKEAWTGFWKREELVVDIF